MKMKAGLALLGSAAGFWFAALSPSYAYCSFAGDAQAQSECMQEQIGRARQASEELEDIARQRRLMEALAPETRSDPSDLGNLLLKSRERDALQDLGSALRR